MRYLYIGLGVLAALVGLVVAVGAMLPVGHRATRMLTLAASPESTFALIAGLGVYPEWRSGVTSMELPSDARAAVGTRFREHGSDGTILFEITEVEAGRRMVSRIADRSLPFGGSWTYEVTATPQGSTLRITEDGEVYNPLFRFVSRFIMGHTHTIDRYLGDVATRLGGGEIR